MASKNDLEIQRVKSSTDKFGFVCGLFEQVVRTVGGLGALWIIFAGLKPFLASNPATINAMSALIEKINISNITGYFLAAAVGTGWLIERKGKKRAIKQKGKYQKMVEENDPYRSSSGLTSIGETPGGES